jgi:protease II
LRVYGFYGLPNEVLYDNMNYGLLENGWTIAFAHVRGGNEKGKQWHRQTANKKSVIWSDL